MPTARLVAWGALCAISLTVIVTAPLVGWAPVVRLPAVLVPALLLAASVARPWQWDARAWRALACWQPSSRVIAAGGAALTMLLGWIVLTRFQSGEINAVDLTVYFDRPCFQTMQGRTLFIETADFTRVSNQSALAHHAYWAMLPICGLYAVATTPLWLLGLSVVAVVAGAVHVFRLLRHTGAGGALSVAAALAFALNDNTARTLNYGFHPEVLYAWFVPWMLDAGIRGRRRSFFAAMMACLLVKEDAFLPLFAVSAAIGLHRFRELTLAERTLFLVLPVTLGLANFAFYHRHVLPAVTGQTQLIYANFWEHYGATPGEVALGMAGRPAELAMGIWTSGFFRWVLPPFLFLSLVGWRWTIGVAPIVVLYSAAAEPQLQRFGIYYAIVLVPFLAIGAAMGAARLIERVAVDPARARLAAAGVVLAGALLVGSGDRGYTLRPWRSELLEVRATAQSLADHGVVLVQSGLYPHAGYDSRVQLLTLDTLQDPAYGDAVVLMAPRFGAYPLSNDDSDSLARLSSVAVTMHGSDAKSAFLVVHRGAHHAAAARGRAGTPAR